MLGIFCFSAQTATESSDLSNGIVIHIIQGMENNWKLNLAAFHNPVFLDICDLLIRKLAHMTEYAILASSVSISFYVYGRRGKTLLLFSELVCLLYAMTDEFHQLFVPGRAGRVTDVLIDATGALAGCLLMFLVFRHRRSNKK
jgi:Predicted integral membrane protein